MKALTSAIWAAEALVFAWGSYITFNVERTEREKRFSQISHAQTKVADEPKSAAKRSQ